jgi:DNA (cytosine-5)-methyltransferase 1
MKPDYTPLTMQEVNEKSGRNGYKVVSTFTGAGGSCLGLKLAGFNILYAVEFIPEAQRTYQENHKNSYLDNRDIRQIKGYEILNKINVKKGDLDLLEGSPPCASFSNMGIRKNGWGCVKEYSDTIQRTDDLFFEFIRLANEMQPKMILCENVSALKNKNNRGYLKLILNEFKDAGYDVKLKIINSKYLNVPQQRERLILIGKRHDLPITIKFPKPKNYQYTVKDAIPNFKTNKPKEPYINIRSRKMREILEYCQRKHLNKLSKGRWDLYHEWSGHLRVIFENEPCWTILQSSQQLHGYQPRTLSIDEVKALHTFPSDFKLTGTFYQQWERIGRAVPPRMYEQIGLTIRQSLDEYNAR